MANYQPMGVEPAPAVGPSASSRSGAHHRVCSCTSLRKGSAGPLAYSYTRVCTRSMRPAKDQLAESAVATLSPSQMVRSAALLGSPCASTSGAEKSMEACAWSMRPASAVVALVRGREQCQWQGSVTKKPRQVSMRLASPCCGVCSSASFVTGADGSIGGRACSCSQANAWRCR